MTDIVERLGYHREHPATGQLVLANPDGPEAAATITALREERSQARKTAAGVLYGEGNDPGHPLPEMIQALAAIAGARRIGETANASVLAGLERETTSACESADVSSQSELTALREEVKEARAGWKTASELLDAAVGDYNTEHAALTALRQRVVEVVGPFAGVPPMGGDKNHRLMVTVVSDSSPFHLYENDLRAARALINEIKETTDGR